MTFELKDSDEEQQREQEVDHVNALLCLNAVLDTISQATIRSGVFREGEFTVNRFGVKLKRVLFDTGALQASYVNSELVERNRGSWKRAIKPLVSMVKMADQMTKVRTTEKLTGRISFLNNDKEEKSAMIEAIVWVMPELDFILGLPDVLRNFLPMFVQMLNEAQKTLHPTPMDIAEIIQEEGEELQMRPYETKMWSRGASTEAPEERETYVPSHFDPVLQFMEIPYDDAKREYLEMLDKHIGEMLSDSKELKVLLTSELALGRFVPKKWEGIKCPPLELKVRGDFPASHKVHSRPINPRMYQHTKLEFERLCQYMYKPSTSPWASPLVVAPKATEDFIRFCGDYRCFNAYC